jgi:hypothetical protein
MRSRSALRTCRASLAELATELSGSGWAGRFPWEWSEDQEAAFASTLLAQKRAYVSDVRARPDWRRDTVITLNEETGELFIRQYVGIDVEAVIHAAHAQD